jgi:hypothetical protein
MAAPRSTKAKPLRAGASAVPRASRRSLTVDDYCGMTAAAAVEAARAAGLRPAPERIQTEEAAQHGLVVAHEPAPGDPATRGTIVSLYVATPQTAEAPAPETEAEFPAPEQPAGTPSTSGALTHAVPSGGEHRAGEDAASAPTAPPPAEPAEREAEPPRDVDHDWLADALAAEALSAARTRRKRTRRFVTGAATALVIALLAVLAAVAPHTPAVRHPHPQLSRPLSQRALQNAGTRRRRNRERPHPARTKRRRARPLPVPLRPLIRPTAPAPIPAAPRIYTPQPGPAPTPDEFF